MVNGRTLVTLALAGAVYFTLNCGQKSPDSRQLNSRNLAETTQTTEVPAQVSSQILAQPVPEAQAPPYPDTNPQISGAVSSNNSGWGYPQVPILGFSANPQGSGPWQYRPRFLLGGKEFEAFFVSAKIETFSEYFLEEQRKLRDSIENHLPFDRQTLESLATRFDYRNKLNTFLVADMILYSSNPGQSAVDFGDFSALQGNMIAPIYFSNNVLPGGMAGPTYGQIVFDAVNQTIAGTKSIPVSDKHGVLVRIPFKVSSRPSSVYDLDSESYDLVQIVDKNGQNFDIGRVRQIINESRQRPQ